MVNHPNRGRDNPDANPAPEAIKAAREAAGLSQTEAGDLVRSALRTWQQWEAGDRRMHPGLWELFQIKAEKETSVDMTEIIVDDENSADEFWRYVASAADAPEELRKIEIGQRLKVRSGRAEEIRAWCNSAPGFSDGPEYAPDALIFLGA